MKEIKATRQIIDKKYFKGCVKYCQKTWGPISYIKFITNPIEGVQDLPSLTQLNHNKNCEIFGCYNETQKTYYVFPRIKNRKIRAPKNCSRFFEDFGTQEVLPNLQEIDVSGLDVSLTDDFSNMFEGVGRNWVFVDVKGLDKWDVRNAYDCSRMFKYFNAGLDGPISLHLNGWNVEVCIFFTEMFCGCGQDSNYLDITGLETWKVKSGKEFDGFMASISKSANFQIDLSKWDCKDMILPPSDFTTNNFFRIIEPNWDQMIHRNKLRHLALAVEGE